MLEDCIQEFGLRWLLLKLSHIVIGLLPLLASVFGCVFAGSSDTHVAGQLTVVKIGLLMPVDYLGCG